jgi:signal peptide peptidase SppA
MLRNPALFARIFNTALMIHPSKLDAIIGGIGQRFGIDAPQPDMALIASGEFKRPGYQVIGGVAVIDVFGVLAHRGGFDANSSYVLGYDRIGKAINTALQDAEVAAILLQMDSPGGEVSGAFELAQQIRDWQAIKPIKASVSSLAASAAYLIASATQEIAITDTGMAGSIGVVMRHADISKMAEKEGVSVTHIFAGARKVDGNQFAPLSKDVRERFQAEIDQLYTLFVNTVSQNRGLTAEAVRGQEAGVFTGQDAIQAGLADRIATPDQMLAEMQKQFSKTNRSHLMAATTEPAGDAAALEKTKAEAFEQGKQAGLTAGKQAERERIGAILNHEAAAGREATAKVLALETDMDAEAAAKVLAASPKVEPQAQAKGDQFSQHMAKLGNPAVGADDGAAEEQSDNVVVLQGWNQAFKQATAYRGSKR